MRAPPERHRQQERSKRSRWDRRQRRLRRRRAPSPSPRIPLRASPSHDQWWAAWSWVQDAAGCGNNAHSRYRASSSLSKCDLHESAFNLIVLENPHIHSNRWHALDAYSPERCPCIGRLRIESAIGPRRRVPEKNGSRRICAEDNPPETSSGDPRGPGDCGAAPIEPLPVPVPADQF